MVEPERQETNEAPGVVLAFMRAFVAARRWTFAKTYAKTAPHWYTVRKYVPTPEGETDFEEFIIHLREYGYDRPFGRKTYRTFNLDGKKYWTMGAPLAETIIINRVPVNLKPEDIPEEFR